MRRVSPPALAAGLLAMLCLTMLPGHAEARPVDQDWLQSKVDEVRGTYKLVALGAGVQVTSEVPVVAVSGTISTRSEEPISVKDAWHLGSNTKALTALLYARLVEKGETSWGRSVADLFEGKVETIDPAWGAITVEDLLAHRSGAGQVGPLWLMARHSDQKPVAEQRLATVRERLASPPPETPGGFEYSNLNYIIAGAAIEAMTGQTWEEAIMDRVIQADGSDWSEGWGFGPPPSGPIGHGTLFGMKIPQGRGSDADNPPALGPAGTMHAPIGSHLRLLTQFVDQKSPFITPQMRGHLLTPWPDGDADYAMGWGVSERDGIGQVIAHRGSNTMWLSHAELLPDQDAVLVVNTNMFTDASREAVSAIEARLAETGD